MDINEMPSLTDCTALQMTLLTDLNGVTMSAATGTEGAGRAAYKVGD